MLELKTFGFVGLGLIGGPLAKCIRAHVDGCMLMAYTPSGTSAQRALEAGVIDLVCCSEDDPQFSQCDMIFLCAPVISNIRALPMLKTVLSPGCLLTDVGSVKTGIHEAVKREGLEDRFIGGHPMAGSEKTGFENASEYLFENAYYILTPTQTVPEEWYQLYRDLVLSFRALPIRLDYAEHDYITAAVSHLPHVIAASLVNTVHDLDNPQEHMKLIAAGGFRDITRIASSSPDMWEQICTDNAPNLIRVMDSFLQMMHEAREKIRQKEGSYVHRMFEESRDYRDSFSFSSSGPLKKNYRIYCDIIDEAGAIATIATILAVAGISIKNIGIVHNREFEEGVLCIDFYDETSVGKAVAILRHHRYVVTEAK